MEITDIIFFYFPIVLGLFEILFLRKCVKVPKFPKIIWGLLLFTFIPVLGATLSYSGLVAIIAFTIGDGWELYKDNKFVKKWLLN